MPVGDTGERDGRGGAGGCPGRAVYVQKMIAYYQGVVTECLRADRALFLITECCIQLNDGLNPDRSGPHWYCDAEAIYLRDRCVNLCESRNRRNNGGPAQC